MGSASKWTMSHVCRQVRSTVTGAPTLWTKFEIDLSREGSVDISQLHFDRSAASKLFVTLLAPSDIEPQSLGPLIPHLRRVSELRVVFGSLQALDTILAPFRDITVTAPSLVHLCIENVCDESDEPAIDFSPLQAHNLTYLKLIRCYAGHELPQWARTLTHLELRNSAALHDKDSWMFLLEGLDSKLRSLTHLYLEWGRDIEYDQFTSGGLVTDSLKHLGVEFYSDNENAVLDTVACFAVYKLTHLIVHGSHGDNIAALFNYHSDFDPDASDLSDSDIEPYPFYPWLTSLTFANIHAPDCDSAHDCQPTSAPPLHIFPNLTSLALLKQCFTANILSDLLGPNADPWPLLETVVVWPLEADTEAVYTALQEIVRGKRSRQPEERVPTFVLSPGLFERSHWTENGVDVELLENLDGYATWGPGV